jgi:23S rRNA (uridine2552-2'-O)-methyltransferase
LPKAWIKAHKREYYYRKAKEEKYRSRASYKLLQVIERYQFIKSGDVVVDLGAAPGGWMQVAQKTIGNKGFVLGIDINPIQPFETQNFQTVVADIMDPQIIERIKEYLPRQADVVLSDVSPNISGIWEVDNARQIDLARRSLEVATSILKSNGNFFAKVFQGEMTGFFAEEVKRRFAFVKLVKPKASRPKSAELYILAINLLKSKG